MEGKILAIDYGKKRVGVATGDLSMKMAFPRVVIENKGLDFLIREIGIICEELNPKIVLVGWPMNMSVEMMDNKMMREVRIFFDHMLIHLSPLNVEVRLVDERLSTFEAEDLLRSSKISSRDLKKNSDAVAAQIILQRYFDEMP